MMRQKLLPLLFIPFLMNSATAQFNPSLQDSTLNNLVHPAGYKPCGLGELGKLRYELFKQYLWNTTNEQLQADLTELARQATGRIVLNAAYHPAVRYNAVLVLGMLDQQYAIEGKRPAKPLPWLVFPRRRLSSRRRLSKGRSGYK